MLPALNLGGGEGLQSCNVTSASETASLAQLRRSRARSRKVRDGGAARQGGLAPATGFAAAHRRLLSGGRERSLHIG